MKTYADSLHPNRQRQPASQRESNARPQNTSFANNPRVAAQRLKISAAFGGGALQRVVKIEDTLNFNLTEGKPVIGESVLKSPPEYLNADVDGKKFRLLAGQDFISEKKGAEYIANGDAIIGADARLLKPMVNDNMPEDVRVVGDGHHKLLFSSYHAKACAGGTKLGFCKGQPWSGLKWVKDLKE
jgi:hypothetical protein